MKVQKCKKCYGRGYVGQFINIGGEDVKDKNQYKTCLCVTNADIREQRAEFEKKVREGMEKRLKKKHEKK
jgi:hypothetical protein